MINDPNYNRRYVIVVVGVVQDSLETALNSSGDVVFAATAELRERRKRGESLEI